MTTETAEGVRQHLKYQTWILKVPIHCRGCERKVKRVLHTVDGVFTTSIDPRLHKVTVTGDVDSETLIKKLVRSGKQAELWPERKPRKSKKKDRDSGGKDSKDDHDHDAEKNVKPAGDQGASESKDSDDEGENNSSETEGKVGEAKVDGSAGGGSGGDGGGGKKKKKKKKKKKGQNAIAEGGRDAPTGPRPHIAGPIPGPIASAPSKVYPSEHSIDVYPPPVARYAPVMYGTSHYSANPTTGTSHYYYASPVHYSFLDSHLVSPYPPPDPIGSYHDFYDDAYYDDGIEGGCSIM